MNPIYGQTTTAQKNTFLRIKFFSLTRIHQAVVYPGIERGCSTAGLL